MVNGEITLFLHLVKKKRGALRFEKVVIVEYSRSAIRLLILNVNDHGLRKKGIACRGPGLKMALEMNSPLCRPSGSESRFSRH